jgi:hypothetical protein
MTHAAMVEDPAERVRALIVADEESARLAPDRWPDLSLKALRERETLDRTTLDKFHAVARKDLAREDRTIYDLFEWRRNRRLEQFRLRLKSPARCRAPFGRAASLRIKSGSSASRVFVKRPFGRFARNSTCELFTTRFCVGVRCRSTFWSGSWASV